MARVLISFLALVVALGLTSDAARSADTYRSAPGPAVRVDPYKNFKFRVRIEGRIVAGFAKASGLAASTPGRTPVTSVTLQQGVTHDSAFENWARAEVTKRRTNVRPHTKIVIVEARNEMGQVVTLYTLSKARVSKYQGVPNLNANANEVSIALLELEHDGLTLQ